jgi:hypothetical protein
MSPLILKPALIGDNEDDYDTLADDKVAGRIYEGAASAPPALRYSGQSGFLGDRLVQRLICPAPTV